MQYRFITLLFLVSCGYSAPELSPLIQTGVDAARQGWKDADMPDTDLARCSLHPVVRWAKDNVAFRAKCGTLAAAACTKFETSGELFLSTQYPVITLRPGFVLESNSEPIIHEMMHVQYHCANMQWWLPENVKHLNPQVWSAAEYLPGNERYIGKSAQTRARMLMLDRP